MKAAEKWYDGPFETLTIRHCFGGVVENDDDFQLLMRIVMTSVHDAIVDAGLSPGLAMIEKHAGIDERLIDVFKEVPPSEAEMGEMLKSKNFQAEMEDA
jgi:hypothetical protein